MTDRRSFLRGVGALSGSMLLAPHLSKAIGSKIGSFNAQHAGLSNEEIARDEEFWYWVRQAFTGSENIINLNSGVVSPQPKAVQDTFDRYIRMSNEAPPLYGGQIIDQSTTTVKNKLARIAGCLPEEVALSRNTTESLETVIFGLKLKKGDEVVLTKVDHHRMKYAWNQRALRDGIVLKWIDIDPAMDSTDKMVERFVSQFNSRTKAIEVTHLINWSGQILPVRAIADEAKKRNIDVIVDGAHSFCHFDFKIPDLNCDYFGTSLHKWLCAPYGTGMLYVRKGKAKDLWPLYASPEPLSDDIKKFEFQGTENYAKAEGIAEAISFHEMIGIKRKEARLRFLKNYWAEKAANISKVKIVTTLSDEYSCAICLFHIDGTKPFEVGEILEKKYKILVRPIDHENVKGLRVTPHIFTTTRELDALIDAIKILAA